MTGDEHILVVEKLKARGTETDASDEEFVFKGELTLVRDVFCHLIDCSSACKSLMIGQDQNMNFTFVCTSSF